MHSLGEEEIDEVCDTLRSSWITSGPKVERFEKDFARYIGVKHAFAVNSCTAGLHLGLEAVGVKENDLVVTTPYTFTSTSEVIGYLGADPLFIDIKEDTFLLDVKKVAEYFEKSCFQREGNLFDEKTQRRIAAIVPVHIAGQSCDMDSLSGLSERFNVPVVEDAAHSLPTTYKNRMIGTIGDVTAFSFYATKTITTGEGGMVTTNNDKVAARIKIMRLHGINRDSWNRNKEKTPSWSYQVVESGFKYNMTDIAASIGIHQLKKADSFHQSRTEIAQKYNEAFAHIEGLKTPLVESYGTHSWHLYILQISAENMERDLFIEKLAEQGIATSVHFIPLHVQPFYQREYGFQSEDFPVAYKSFQKVVSLPIYPKMTEADVERVIESVLKIM